MKVLVLGAGVIGTTTAIRRERRCILASLMCLDVAPGAQSARKPPAEQAARRASLSKGTVQKVIIPMAALVAASRNDAALGSWISGVLHP